MTIDVKLIDQLLTDYKKPEDIIGENGLLKQLTKAILERALTAEMSDHLGLREARSGGPPPGQHAQREKRNNLARRFWRVGARNSTRSPSHIRAENRSKAPDALDRLRRQDHLHVRAGHDDTRDPGPSGGDLWHRGLARADLQRDRGGGRRSETVARAAAGGVISHRVSGRADGEGARRRDI